MAKPRNKTISYDTARTVASFVGDDTDLAHFLRASKDWQNLFNIPLKERGAVRLIQAITSAKWQKVKTLVQNHPVLMFQMVKVKPFENFLSPIQLAGYLLDVYSLQIFKNQIADVLKNPEAVQKLNLATQPAVKSELKEDKAVTPECLVVFDINHALKKYEEFNKEHAIWAQDAPLFSNVSDHLRQAEIVIKSDDLIKFENNKIYLSKNQNGKLLFTVKITEDRNVTDVLVPDSEVKKTIVRTFKEGMEGDLNRRIIKFEEEKQELTSIIAATPIRGPSLINVIRTLVQIRLREMPDKRMNGFLLNILGKMLATELPSHFLMEMVRHAYTIGATAQIGVQQVAAPAQDDSKTQVEFKLPENAPTTKECLVYDCRNPSYYHSVDVKPLRQYFRNILDCLKKGEICLVDNQIVLSCAPSGENNPGWGYAIPARVKANGDFFQKLYEQRRGATCDLLNEIKQLLLQLKSNKPAPTTHPKVGS